MAVVSTLLVGGPKDGDVIQVEEHVPVWVVQADSVFAEYVDEGYDPFVSVRTTGYFPKLVSFFKVPLQVHVHESIEGDERRVEHRLAQHLLSDVGKQIVVRY